MSHFNRLSPPPRSPEPRSLLQMLNEDLRCCRGRQIFYTLLSDEQELSRQLDECYQTITRQLSRIYELRCYHAKAPSELQHLAELECSLLERISAEQSRIATETQNRLAEQRRKLGQVRESAARLPSQALLAKQQAEALLRKAGIDPSAVLALMAR